MARIKVFTALNHTCRHCGNMQHTVAVYRQYWHIFFVPVGPGSGQEVKIHCDNCTASFRNYEVENQYAKIIKPPVYFYSWPILVGAIIVFAVIGNFLE